VDAVPGCDRLVSAERCYGAGSRWVNPVAAQIGFGWGRGSKWIEMASPSGLQLRTW